jgi:hypothetical protein
MRQSFVLCRIFCVLVSDACDEKTVQAQNRVADLGNQVWLLLIEICSNLLIDLLVTSQTNLLPVAGSFFFLDTSKLTRYRRTNTDGYHNREIRLLTLKVIHSQSFCWHPSLNTAHRKYLSYISLQKLKFIRELQVNTYLKELRNTA